MDGGGGHTQCGCAHCHWSAKVARRGPCAIDDDDDDDGTQTPGSWGSWEVAEGAPSLALGCGGPLTEDDGSAVATVRRQRAPSPHAPAGYCGLSGLGFGGGGRGGSSRNHGGPADPGPSHIGAHARPSHTGTVLGWHRSQPSPWRRGHVGVKFFKTCVKVRKITE